MNIMKQQIRDLFTNPEETMKRGLWFSGYKNEGEYKEWYDNGQLYQHYWYKNGDLDGEFKMWYENGELHYDCWHENGELNGEFKRWYDNGQLSGHFWYKNDKKIADLIEHPELKKKYNIKY